MWLEEAREKKRKLEINIESEKNKLILDKKKELLFKKYIFAIQT